MIIKKRWRFHLAAGLVASVFLLLIVKAVLPIGKTYAATSNYTYSGITTVSGTHIARRFSVTVNDPSDPTLDGTIDSLTTTGSYDGTPDIRTGIFAYASDFQATNPQYVQLTSSDDSRMSIASSAGKKTVFWSQFLLAETVDTISNIAVTFEGSQASAPTSTEKLWLGVWNESSASWDYLNAAQMTSEGTLTANITHSFDDYIDGTGLVTFIVLNEAITNGISIDQFKIDVTYIAATSNPPQIESLTANDPDDGDRYLSDGDTLTILFDKATNAPAAASKTDIDGLLTFANSLGANYTGAWSTTNNANDTLTITISNSIGGSLDIGDSVTIISDGSNDLKNSASTSAASTDSELVEGNWGLKPSKNITYAVDHSNSTNIWDSRIFEVDTSTGELALLGSMPFQTYTLARRASDGILFSVENNSLGSASAVAYFDPSTGISTTLPSTIGVPVNLTRLAFDPSDTLYAMASASSLYTIDTTTGIATTACATVSGITTVTGGDIAFRADGTMFLISGTDLYTVDTVGCTATLVGATGIGSVSTGLSFTDSGILYATVEGTAPVGGPVANQIFEVDSSTGAGSFAQYFSPDFQVSDIASSSSMDDIEIGLSTASTFLVGNSVSYTIAVKNNGPDTEDGPIIMETTLPTGLTLVSASGTGWSCSSSGQIVRCTRSGTLASGASANNITISATLGSAALPSVSMSVSAKGDLIDTDSSNNTATLVSPVSDVPAIAYSKADNDADNIVIPGADITYTITLANTGGSATGITLADTLDSDLENLRTITTNSCGTPTDSSTSTALSLTNISIASSATCTVTFIATVKAATADNSTVNNTATAGAATEGGTTSGSLTSDVITVRTAPTFTITKVENDADNDVLRNQTVRYTVTIANSGGLGATGVTVSDPLDSDLDSLNLVSTSSCGTPTDSSTSTALSLSSVAIASGATCTIIYDADVTNTAVDGATVTNTVTVGAATEGGSGGTASASTLTVRVPVLTLSKTDDDADNSVNISQNVTYTITIANSGGVAATGVTVEDTIDSDLENVTSISTSSCGTPTDSSTSTKLDLASVSIASGGTCTITFVANVKAGTAGGSSIPNSVTVGNPTEGGSGGSASTASLTVVNLPAIGVTLSENDADNTVSLSQTVGYTLLVANTGGTNGTGIVVTSALDSDIAGLTNVVFSSCGGAPSDSSTGTALNITVDVTSGGTCTVTFDATVIAGAADGATIPATATAAAATEGGTGGSGSASTLTVAYPILSLSLSENDADDIVNPSQTVSYTMSSTNSGTLSAVGTQFLLTLDADLGTSLTNVVFGGGCTSTTNNSTTSLFDVTVTIASGATCTITYDTTVNAGVANAATILASMSSVAGSNGGNTPGANATTLTAATLPSLTLTLAENDADDIVNPSQTVSYTMSSTNSGGLSADATQFLLTLDADLGTSLANVAFGGGCTSITNSSTTSLFDVTVTIASGATCTITYDTTVNAGVANAATILASMSSVAGSNGGNAPGANATTLTAATLPAIGVTLSENDADNTVSLSQTVGYTLLVANTGGTNGTGIVVTSALDADIAGLTNVVFSSCGGAPSDSSTGTNLNVTVDVTSGGTCTVTFDATVIAGAADGATIPATATAAAATEGGTGGSGSASTLTVAYPILSLSLSENDADDIVNPSQTVSYTMSSTNSGTLSAVGTQFLLTLDADLGTSLTNVVFGGGCTATTNNSTTSIFDVTVTIASGATCTITYDVTVNAGAANGATIPASLTSVAGSNGGNAPTASASTLTVATLPALSVTMAENDADDSVSQSQLVSYTVVVSNSGGTTGTGIVVTSALDADIAGLTNVAFSSCGGAPSDSSTGTNLNVTVETASSGSCTITFDATVNAGAANGATIPATATAAAAVEGGTGGSGSASTLTVTVALSVPSLTLTLSEDDANDIVNPNQSVTYTMESTNSGGQSADGTQFVGTLDTDLGTSLTNVVFGGGCTATTNNSTTSIFDVTVTIASGATCTITYDVTVNAGAANGATIPASLTSVAGSNGGNAPTASASTLTVATLPAIGVTLTENDADNTVSLSQTVGYTLLVANTGGTNGTGIVVTSALDADIAGLTNVVFSSCGGAPSDSSTGTALNITVDVTSGGTCTVTFDATVIAGAADGATIPATATAAAATEGGTGGSGSASTLTVAYPVITVSITEDDADNVVSRSQTVTYTAVVSNSAVVGASGVDLTNTFDSTNYDNLSVVATAGCGAFTDSSTASSPVLSLVGVSISAGGSCTVVLSVTVKSSAVNGAVISDTISASAPDEGGVVVSAAAPNLTVYVPSSSGGGGGGGGGGGAISVPEPAPTSPSNVEVSLPLACSVTSSISVDVKASNAKLIAIANNPLFRGVSYRPFDGEEKYQIDLLPGDGTRYIYVKFKSASGVESDIYRRFVKVDSVNNCGEEEPIPTQKLCDLDCKKMTLDVYIVNPDKSERHTGSQFVKVTDIEPGIADYAFEDKGNDFDYNDLVIRVDRRDCGNINFNVKSLDAGWNHVVKVKTFYDGVLQKDEIVWPYSQKAVGASIKVDPRADLNQCFVSDDTYLGKTCSKNCSDYKLDVFITNPDGTERHTGSNFVTVREVRQNVFWYSFEDKGNDFDYNDLVVEVDRTNCAAPSFKIISLDAGWHHKVSFSSYYKGELEKTVMIFGDSHKSVGESAVIGLSQESEDGGQCLVASYVQPNPSAVKIMAVRIWNGLSSLFSSLF